MKKLKVFVSGASGNVGRKIVRKIIESEDMELVGGFAMEVEDLGLLAGLKLYGMKSTNNLKEGLEKSIPDVVVDFTSANIIMDNIKAYVDNSIDAVIGTTGFTPEMLEEVKQMVKENSLRFIVISNYGLGINLVIDFLKKASKHYQYATITDRHTSAMANAPSGTAMLLADHIDSAIGDVKSREVIKGVLGASYRNVRIHSERLPYPGSFSEHTITLGREDEIVKITVTDFSSSVYIDGVILSLKRIKTLPKGSFITRLSDIGDTF
ncbi:MAG: 4-hydroxy-tetrahydrodipicolinate reductase [Synergistetes bacterium]|nr:4-hydroxy-tetrahydrodipicolinate reductase [Synergistota bacterium]